MKLFHRKKRKIQFTSKSHPFWGIVGAVIGGVAFIVMAILFLSSGVAKGNGGAYLGYLGILNLIMGVTGLFISVKCFGTDDIYLRFPVIGSILNGIVSASYIILYFLGSL